jgi:hypothetical protein
MSPTCTVACGVTIADSADGAPVPATLVAATVNVYATPLVSPVTLKAVLADPTSRVAPPVTPVAIPPVPLKTSTW